jgi:hypothetical protein
MKKLLPLILVVISTAAFAQKFSIRGQLVDTLSNPLPSATILLLNPKDSSLVNFVLGDVNGNFTLKNVSKGEHLIKVSYIGFSNFTKKITTPETAQVIGLGKLQMTPRSNELEAIEIEAEKAPVVIKKDTIEFNAGSFKTKPNAVVEDLLKKLPGVEVDTDGNITAQGEQVRNVTVDGKKFFGSDPKLATKNLPADAINKVQLFDKKSDQTTFSGIDDGSREKTINLELKEEKRNGAFGSIMAGIGNDGRYQGRASLNRFTKSRQWSVLGMGNNVNEQGFSMEDYMNFTGGSQQMMAGGGGARLTFNSENANGVPLNFGNRANGIMSNIAGGINLNNQFSRKTELNGSYFFNYLDHQRNQSTFRENFLPAGGGVGSRNAYNFDQNSVMNNTNLNHRVNLTLDHKIDSTNSLKLTSAFTFNETDSENRSASRNLSSEGAVQNETERLSLSSGTNASFNSTLLWRHRFAKKGRTFSTSLQFNYGDNQTTGFLDATTKNYFTTPADTVFRQVSDQSTQNAMYGATLSYTEPLGGRKYLEANYTFRKNLNDVERNVSDVSGDAPVYDEQLSNLYNSDYEYHRAGLNFRMNRTKYNFTVGGSIQQTYLKGYLELRDVDISRDYQNVLPTVRFNYEFSTAKRLSFDYETSVQEPSIQELQPVVDNSDPLNIYEGNPALRPAYSQSWRMNFTTFNPVNFMSFFAFADVDYITNSITNSRSINEQFVSVTKPVNVDNNMSVAGNASLSFPINKIKSRFTFGGTIRNRRSINLLNDIASTINTQSAGGNARYSYRYKEIFDFSLSARLERQLTDYEFQQNDQIFLNNNYTAETNLTILKNYQFSSSFEILQYDNQNNNYSQTIPLLNLSVSRFLLKNKTGELKFAVNNLLDKALGVNQTANLNYTERQTTNSLGRIFMVSFAYSINKQLNPMGMRRGGQMMRIMR